MGASDRQLLLKTLKVVDLLIMAGVFLLAAVPVSRGGEASFAQFLSLRIKVENFILFFGLLGLWHIHFVALGVYQSQRLASLKEDSPVFSERPRRGRFVWDCWRCSSEFGW